MNTRRLLSYVRQAADDYVLIEEHDKIAAGLSGGKDSLTMLYALKKLQRFYPKHFELTAITVHLGFEDFHPEPIAAFCKELDVPYKIIHTDIAGIVFGPDNVQNPCSLCARLRKGAFNEAALQLGCNKTAYAHHRDDLIETMMLSLLYEGRFSAFSPYTYLDRMDLTVIRPLMFVTEPEVVGFQHKYQLPVCKNPCPVDGQTKREYVKNLAKQLEKENPGAKNRMFRAILDGQIPGWPAATTKTP